MLIIGLLYNSLGLSASPQEVSDRERIHIDFAKSAILFSILNSSSPAGRNACSVKNYACAGPDRAELGLALIESSKGMAAASALVDITAYQIDAAISEEYHCALIYNKKLVATLLRKADSRDLQSKCEIDAKHIISSAKLYDDVDMSTVCLSAHSIKKRIVDNLDMLKRVSSCNP